MKSLSNEWKNLLKSDSDRLPEILDSIKNLSIKPSYEDIFNFAKLTPLNNLKVIILGQDPYDTEFHAHGLAFSSQQPNTPRSLANIFKALKQSGLIKNKPITNNLTSWAAQGVLLLNAALTVLQGKPESHIALWENYIQSLIIRISTFAMTKLHRKLVIILWGAKAKKFGQLFGEMHHILYYKHPSPLAGDFSECPNFIECNKILTESKQDPINWDPDFKNWLEVYTDGSSEPNKTGPDVQSGYGAIFAKGLYEGLKIYGKTTNEPPYYSNNIRAEGTAILMAMKKVDQLNVENRKLLHILTDSEFWISMIYEWIPSWIAKGGIEEFQNHKNPDLVKSIWQTYLDLSKQTFIVLSHVYSHDKKNNSQCNQNSSEYRHFFYNNLCDILANHARQKLQTGQYGETTSPFQVGDKKI
jgi:uracil-DNA glycosylase